MRNLQRKARLGLAFIPVLIFLVFLVSAHAFEGFQSSKTSSSEAAPTVAHVTEFMVIAGKGGALLQWRTGFELDNLGFNLYRERGGQRTLINPSLIAGSAFKAGNGTPLMAGHPYTWRDAKGTIDSLYYLESVDLNGATNIIGPVAPLSGNIQSKEQQATLLSNLGADVKTAQVEGPATLMSAAGQSPEGMPLNQWWNITAQPAVKILVRADNWYHVTQPELVAAGFNPSSDANNLQLYVDGIEQPLLVKSTNGTIGAGDYIEFYGTGLDRTDTDTHVYWLVNGSTPGKRIKLIGNERPDAVAGDEKPPQVTPRRPPIRHKVERDDPTGGVLWNFMQVFGLSREVSAPQPPQATAQESQPASVIQSAEPPALDQLNTGSDVIVQESPAQRDQSAKPARQADAAQATDAPKQSAAPEQQQPAARPSVAASVAAQSPTSAKQTETQPEPRKARATRKRARAARSRAKLSAARRELSHYSAAAPLQSSAGEARSFAYTVQLKEHKVYYSSLLNGEKENWFGQVIVGNVPVTQTLNVTHLDTSAPDSVVLEVALQGASLVAHNIAISINNVQVGSASYFFRDNVLVTIPLSISHLREGSNDVKLLTTTIGDTNIVDYIRLTYPHTYQADNNSLRFSLKNSQTARVEGFTTPDIRLLDITDPLDVQQLRPMIEPSGAGYALVIGTLGRNTKGRRTFVAFPNGQAVKPSQLVANQPSQLNSTSGSADLAVISYAPFKQNIAPLADLRRSQGMSVSVLDVEDVFDEFSYGTHTCRAIKDFLAYTKANWAKAPRFVLLAGDSSYDPKNYGNKGFFDFVPSKLVDTIFMESVSDDWLTDFNGDAVPDIALGRLPARTAADLDVMVSKIVNYNINAVNKSALFVADEQGSYPFSFEEENRSIAALLPSDVSVTHIDKSSNPNINVTRGQFFNSLNQGPMIVNYAGHGTVDAWTGAKFLTNDDALVLTNGTNNANHLPLFVMMTCLNGYYNDPGIDAIAAALLKAPQGGAVAAWASSGLTVPTGQALANQSLYQSIYGNPSMTLGEAVQKAKAATPDTDVRLTWTLLGDPTMKIR